MAGSSYHSLPTDYDQVCTGQNPEYVPSIGPIDGPTRIKVRHFSFFAQCPPNVNGSQPSGLNQHRLTPNWAMELTLLWSSRSWADFDP